MRKVNDSQKREGEGVIGISRHRLGTDGDGDRLEGQIIRQGDARPPFNEFPHWEPEYVYKKIFFKECPIAGLSFHIEKDDDLWLELEVGTQLALVRERNNKHDKNAVAVALADDYDGDPEDFDFDFILGYIPITENQELAAMMDAGYADKLSAEITTCKQFGSYNDRIRITIFIKSNEAEIVRPDLLRAQSLSVHELRTMTEELSERGTAYFRWGGFPHYELQFSDKISISSACYIAPI